MMNSNMASSHTTNRQPLGSRLQPTRDMSSRDGPRHNGDEAHAPLIMRNNQILHNNNIEAFREVAVGLSHLTPNPVRMIIRYFLNNHHDQHVVLRDYIALLEYLVQFLPRGYASAVALASALASAYTSILSHEVPRVRAAAQEHAGSPPRASAWVRGQIRPAANDFGRAVDRNAIPEVQIIPDDHHLAFDADQAQANSGINLVDRFTAACHVLRTSSCPHLIIIGLLLFGIAMCILCVHQISGILFNDAPEPELSPTQVYPTEYPCCMNQN